MKKILLFISTILLAASLNAQVSIGANFVFAFPNGNFGDIASPATGGGIEVNFFLSDRFLLGIEAQFTNFANNNDAIFDIDMQSVPITLKAEYYLSDTKLRPFIGLGLGYYIVSGEINLGTAGNGLNFDLNGYGLSPRFGFVYDFSPNSAVAFNMQYNIVYGQEYESESLKDLLDPFTQTNYFSLVVGYRFTFGSNE